jgi:hypothetical protein
MAGIYVWQELLGANNAGCDLYADTIKQSLANCRTNKSTNVMLPVIQIKA